MKKLRKISFVLMAAVSMLMVSCDLDDLLHASMLRDSSWGTIEDVTYRADDGLTYSGVLTTVFHFETSTKGKMSTKLVSSYESREVIVPFKYTFSDNGFYGTLTISDGDCSGSYSITYSRCDEALILYGTEGVWMVLSKMDK